MSKVTGVEILNGDFKIKYNGCVHICNESPLDIVFSFDNREKLTIRIEIISNNKEKQGLVKLNESNRITFKCVNFTTSFGTGLKAPILLFKLQSLEYYITFWVYSLGKENNKKLEYTIYEKNGEF